MIDAQFPNIIFRQGAHGGTFFAAGRALSASKPWTELHDRWEYSHVARALFAWLAFLALVVAAARPV